MLKKAEQSWAAQKEYIFCHMRSLAPSQVPSLAKKTIINDDKKNSFLEFAVQVLRFQSKKKKKKSVKTLRKKVEKS